ncbi:hypothetical protein ACFFK0_01510 [Paenibacillus chartarius]|uniref:Transmembrane protein n=1 Tax=Paenibacillus chartarius TaxID=747481 RepID=A0ABV6DEQ9_9BACL
MNEMVLAVFGSVLGVAVTAALIYTAWAVRQLANQRGGTPEAQTEAAAKLFMHWSAFDAAVLALFGCGTLLLLADLLGVLRDRASYPLYHYGYLLCGVVFSFLGMVLMVIRLAIVLRTSRLISGQPPSARGGARSGTPDEHDEPADTDQTE